MYLLVGKKALQKYYVEDLLSKNSAAIQAFVINKIEVNGQCKGVSPTSPEVLSASPFNRFTGLSSTNVVSISPTAACQQGANVSMEYRVITISQQDLS